MNQGLDYAAFVMYLYHVAADHYTLSPTEVVLRGRPWKDVMKELRSTTERWRWYWSPHAIYSSALRSTRLVVLQYKVELLRPHKGVYGRG